MQRDNLIPLALLFAAVAGGVYWYYLRTAATVSDYANVGDGTADTTLGSIEASVQATVSGWKSVGSAAQWLPTLTATEQGYGMPADLLARVAYQESHFREEIIRGTMVSPAGALGIMQMLPKYFATVNVPVPYTNSDVSNQIEESAQQMESLYQQFGSWQLALAAYNAGAGNVRKYGGIPPFAETQNYVAQISADVPALVIA